MEVLLLVDEGGGSRKKDSLEFASAVLADILALAEAGSVHQWCFPSVRHYLADK